MTPGEIWIEISFLLGITAYGAVCYWIGLRVERWWWRGEMVQRGHARYHFYDGKWYWNEDMPKPTDPAAYRVAKLTASKP